MVWNTIAHPKMMDDTNGTGNEPAAFDNVVFSKEALEPPIKHMNRDLLATFDYIIWTCLTAYSVPDENKFSKNTFLVGDFETLFAAGKNKTIVNGLLINSELGIRQNPDTGAAEYYPVETDGLNFSIRQLSLFMPKSLYGKMTMEDHKFDFGKDRFVIMLGMPLMLMTSSGEMLVGADVETKLLEYAVDEESSAG